jgi:NarL family two-component system response regulator LiaR
MTTPVSISFVPVRSSRMMFVAQANGAPAVRVLLAERSLRLQDGLAPPHGQPSPVQVVAVATSYAQALYLAGRVAPDVVVLGCFADPLDVLDVLAALQALSNCRVLVHGLDDPDRSERALQQGAAEVLGSPAAAPELVEAILRLHAGRPPAAAAGAVARLTLRERQLITAIVTNPGAKYLVIGAQLGISEHTVHNHLSSIYQKLNLINRADLLLYAVRHRIVADGDAQAEALPAPPPQATFSAISTAKKPPAASSVHLRITQPQRR